MTPEEVETETELAFKYWVKAAGSNLEIQKRDINEVQMHFYQILGKKKT